MSRQSKPSVDLGYPTEARGRIPAFDSLEEEAAWWDAHDADEVWDELEPVKANVSPKFLSEPAMSIRLPEIVLEQLRRRADEKGVGPTTLARMWLLERLEQEENTEAQTPVR
jgi:hypothetical protein